MRVRRSSSGIVSARWSAAAVSLARRTGSRAAPPTISAAAPGELGEHEHAVAVRRATATNSFATRFIPSRSGVTSTASAAR